MAGGIFFRQNKIRPGFYHKFTAKPGDRNLFGQLGTAALPIPLDWGTDEAMILVEADASENEFLQKFGMSKDEILPMREAFKNAHRLYVYRINGGGAKAELNMSPQPVMATAKYAGVLGNRIRVAIEEEISGGTTYSVKTYIDSILRDEQEGVENAEDILDNDWVVFSGSGAITAAAGGELMGGTNATPQKGDYAKFLTLLEGYDCNAFGCMSDDNNIKDMFIRAAKKRNEELGKLSQCVLCDVEAEEEMVSSICNGVLLRDGRSIDKKMAVAWAVGAMAAAGPAKSLTYRAYDGAVAPDTRLSDDEIKAALAKGQMVFVPQNDEAGNEIAVIEQDRNTLTVFSEEKPQPWSKNRVVRALYYLVNSLSRVWHLYYIGKVDNNEIGRNLFKSDLVLLMNSLVEQGAFEDFDPEMDIKISKGDTSESVVAELAVKPVDAMEKIYFTVEVQ